MTQSDREESYMPPRDFNYYDDVGSDRSKSKAGEDELYVTDDLDNGYHDSDRDEFDIFDKIYHETTIDEDYEEFDDETLDEGYNYGEEEEDDDSDYEDEEEHKEKDAPLSAPRLDSFDSYIVVSVLTATASFAALLDDNPEGDKSLTQRAMARNVAILLCAVCSLSGIYSTVVFSFSSIYGRTAIAMRKYEAYETFLASTAPMRKRAFFAYLLSLILFIVLLIIAAVDKIDPQLEIPFAVCLVVLSGLVYRDWSHIIAAAGVIFAPPPTTATNCATKNREPSHRMKLRSHAIQYNGSSNKNKNSNGSIEQQESWVGSKRKQL
jgi:hypothetical protein